MQFHRVRRSRNPCAEATFSFLRRQIGPRSARSHLPVCPGRADGKTRLEDQQRPAAEPPYRGFGQWFDLFAPAAHDDRAVSQEKRAVGSNRRRERSESCTIEIGAAQLIQRQESSRCVAAASAQPRTDRDAFLQPKCNGFPPPRRRGERRRRLQDQVAAIHRHVRDIAFQGKLRRAVPLPTVDHRDQLVAEMQRRGDRHQVMEPVGTEAGDRKK